MKRTLLFVLLMTCISQQSPAQSPEVQQLLMNVEKLAQLKQILTDMKKGYKIISSGYNAVKNLSEGNFNLHKVFLDGLMQVSPAVRNYKKIAEIISYQVMLVKEYKSAYNKFRRNGSFNPQELDYFGRVYSKLFKQSINNLDHLMTVITADKLRMSDDERLQAIDDVFLDLEDKLVFLRHFNSQISILSFQREREKNDAFTMQKIYGLTN
ncbi:TerB family tellurite resistance protein [Rubrolithibacter danxiaensis]|uniref:TerB family tellurite resistance protein n=1 Tax=Rubrolithibacter danxiaensis TaxID=3390805 RepID=UPI003BF91052